MIIYTILIKFKIELNKHVIGAITLSFVISFTILFLMHFTFQDPRTMEDIGTHDFFSSKLNSEKSAIFLIGHSHIGQLNTTKSINCFRGSRQCGCL